MEGSPKNSAQFFLLVFLKYKSNDLLNDFVLYLITIREKSGPRVTTKKEEFHELLKD